MKQELVLICKHFSKWRKQSPSSQSVTENFKAHVIVVHVFGVNPRRPFSDCSDTVAAGNTLIYRKGKKVWIKRRKDFNKDNLLQIRRHRVVKISD